jgi:hypothetical protein
MTSIPISTGSPKKKIVDMAFGKCGIIDYDTDQAVLALNELDSLMLTWPFDQLGYSQPLSGTGSLEEISGIDPRWDLVTALSLAEAVAPLALNAQPLGSDAKSVLARQMSQLRAYVATIPSGIMVSTPAGAGNRRFGFSTFIHET